MVLLVLTSLIVFSAGCSQKISSIPDIDLSRLSAEIEAFERFDRTARYKPDGVVFTGSSSIRFWPDLGVAMDPMPSINRGFGGSTIPEVNFYYDRIITKYRPSIIVLYCGENDLWFGRSVSEVVSDYKLFIKKTRAVLPNTKVVFLSMKPSPSRWEKWDLFQKANKRIQDITEKDPDQYYIDISKYMLDKEGVPIKSIFISDLLHMNKQGYDGWQKIVKPVVRSLYDARKVKDK